MSDWSSFEKDKIVADAWRFYLNEGFLDAVSGIFGGRREQPTPTDDETTDDETTDEEPAAEITYIPRPKWRAFSQEIKTIVVDDKKTQKLLNQMVSQFKANNVKIGTKPVTEAAGAGQVESQFATMQSAIQNLISDPDRYFSKRYKSKLEQFWSVATKAGKTRFQGWSPQHLNKMRKLVKQATVKTKEYVADDSMDAARRERAKTYVFPMLTKFGKVMDATRKGQRKTLMRRYGLPPDATDKQLAKAKHASATSKVSGKNVVGQAGKFMMSGMAVFMKRNLGLNKGQMKAAGAAIQKFVRGNTKLKLGENWVREELDRDMALRRIIEEEAIKLLGEGK